ncbi:uncharacterized protein Z520_04220 [Fonsecaea multimorphosa CBS 102226]|uniref:Uncharacterized protein n=1 Tax=Fonsecaea multimorphosa CBS 102226 TaxID=1442371 RepID=A0A0D2K190_9EURO|nr:uncharacterized protein Z520_04220 [Fonsecaea multimorphosa CBS 102226]KIX99587.1 hypothetical protein Z520_04220 [Fonsecaea multimorphosa CBS 102226]OAL26827.1 hypothetical protein AYO22_03994 [Fonsecaea multimorphosa]
MKADKFPTVVESALTNGGKRTVIDSDLATGAAAPSHYHTDFTEEFTLVSGSMTVWTAEDLDEANFKPLELEVGKPVSVPPNTLHKFLVNEPSRVHCVMTPGTIGFERMILIMRGTAEDGVYKQFSSPESDSGATFYSVLGDLTNTLYVGNAKARLEALIAAKGSEVEAVKQELIAKYATDEHLKKAAGL